MNVSQLPDGLDVTAARLVEELTDRLQAGADLEAFIAAQPEHADTLLRLLPAARMMADLSASTGSGDGLAANSAGLLREPLGDFDLLREIGRGGMGVVYEAVQRSLGRKVAIKVLPLAATMDPRQLQRFRHEAQAAAMLHHANIVPVHGVGCERGVHYYAMQLIEGQSLAAMIDELRGPVHSAGGGTENQVGHSAQRPIRFNGSNGRSDSAGAENPKIHENQAAPISKIPVGTADTPAAAVRTTQPARRDRAHYRHIAELIAQAADALEYAHSMGVVHRDIKPANLLLDESGHLWVTDFGLAKLDAAVGMTVSGDLIGTLRYMSPEQALARHGLADHRADVYSLGATLYEMLTLRPTIDGRDKHELLKQIAFEEPIAPRKLDKAIPTELETIVLKSLAKNPSERYVTAGELADDLRRWMGDKTIKAKPPSLRQRASKWARRHPAAALALTAAILLAVTAGAVWDRQKSVAEATARAVADEAATLQAAGRYHEARAVTRQAASLLPGFGGDQTLRRQIEERAADLDILCKLDEARLEGTTVTGDTGFDTALLSQMYRQAFLDYGVDVLAGDEASVMAALEGRAIRAELAAGLDHWARRTGDGREAAQRLGRLAVALEPSGVLSRVRMAFRAKDTETLKSMDVEATDRALPAVVSRLADALNRSSAAADAERLLRAGLRRHPDDYWLNVELAFLICSVGAGEIKPERAAEAQRYIWAALVLRPHSPGAWLNVGAVAARLKRWDEAELACRKAIELKKDYAWAHVNLGIVLAETNRLDQAEVTFRYVIALKPALASAHYRLGMALAELKRPKDAEQAYRRAIELKSDYAEAYCALGHLLKKGDRPAEAEPAYRKAIDLKPDLSGAHNGLGGLLCDKLRKPADAVPYFRRAIELAPQQPVAYRNLGRALNELGKWADAEAPLRQAIKLNPKYDEAHIDLGICLALLGRSDESVAVFHQAIEVNPSNVGAHYNLALTFDNLNQLAEAEAGYLRTIEVNPDFARAHYSLGRLLRRTGRPDAAAIAFQRAIRLAPNHGDAHLELGNCLSELGRHEDASTAFRDAIKVRPNYAEGHCNLGGALQALRRFKDSLAEYRRGDELGSARRDWPYPSREWVRCAERLVALEPRLPSLLSGEVQAEDAGDELALALFCSHDSRHAAALRFYASAFARQPQLAEDLQAGSRLRAAGDAARAADGKGNDTAQLDDAERSMLRRQSLDWLTADLAAWAKLSDQPDSIARVRLVVERWQRDAALASVCSEESIAKLPEKEREAWRKLWADVAALLAKTHAAGATVAKPD